MHGHAIGGGDSVYSFSAPSVPLVLGLVGLLLVWVMGYLSPGFRRATAWHARLRQGIRAPAPQYRLLAEPSVEAGPADEYLDLLQ